jgi:hypothetical protein
MWASPESAYAVRGRAIRYKSSPFRCAIPESAHASRGPGFALLSLSHIERDSRSRCLTDAIVRI